jgi:hypothetical protein
MRLRAEVARLRAGTKNAGVSRNGGPNTDPIESTAKSWVERVGKLKDRLAQNPEAAIPELKYLNEEDWLSAVKGRDLTDDTAYRAALASLRYTAEQRFGHLIQDALHGFDKATGGGFPTEFSQLQAHFTEPVNPSMFDRWVITSHDTVPNIGVGDHIVTTKAPIDREFDTRQVFGLDGSGTTGWSTQEPKP